MSAVKPSPSGCQTSSAIIPSGYGGVGQVCACIGTLSRLKVMRVIQSADGITQLRVNMPSLHIWEITSARGVLGQSPAITLDFGKREVLCATDRKRTRLCARALTCRIVECGKSESMCWRRRQVGEISNATPVMTHRRANNIAEGLEFFFGLIHRHSPQTFRKLVCKPRSSPR